MHMSEFLDPAFRAVPKGDQHQISEEATQGGPQASASSTDKQEDFQGPDAPGPSTPAIDDTSAEAFGYWAKKYHEMKNNEWKQEGESGCRMIGGMQPQEWEREQHRKRSSEEASKEKKPGYFDRTPEPKHDNNIPTPQYDWHSWKILDKQGPPGSWDTRPNAPKHPQGQ